MQQASYNSDTEEEYAKCRLFCKMSHIIDAQNTFEQNIKIKTMLKMNFWIREKFGSEDALCVGCGNSHL
jgi:hypothetical protein